MTIEKVVIPGPDGDIDGIVASPDDGGRHPGVLVYVDAMGLRPLLEQMADELASHGYVVLMPNPFYRRGIAPVLEVPDLMVPENRPVFFERIGPILREHTVARVNADAGIFLDYLAARPEVTSGPVGVAGYCIGGVYAVRTAAAHPDRVAAVAAFHPGALVTDTADSPHRLADRISAEIYFAFPEHDAAMTPETIGELDRALDTAGVVHTSELYPGLEHGFTMADTALFDAAGLRRHWERMTALFDRALRVSSGRE